MILLTLCIIEMSSSVLDQCEVEFLRPATLPEKPELCLHFTLLQNETRAPYDSILAGETMDTALKRNEYLQCCAFELECCGLICEIKLTSSIVRR